ncbi:MAG: structural protein P5 [Alphaproteobacteria bacterium]|nr:MAG: structural protein P5 [Alphaproteobacteria bacterium]
MTAFPLLPRGIRNNNPGNIRHSSARWRGVAGTQADPQFVVFTEAVFGLRALMCLLLNYHRKFGLDSVESILNRFAPPHENATDHYIAAVTKDLKITRRQRLDLESEETLVALARAMVRHENGKPPDGVSGWYPDETYIKAARLAFGKEAQ